ncbi:hypothetical protein GCT62_03090 [Yersinia enterocolitica]|nr:hypothetical protein [Yersinia enterocolitica]
MPALFCCSACNHDNDRSHIRHLSSCRCVGCTQLPESLTCVSSSGCFRLPPSCTWKSIGYNFSILIDKQMVSVWTPDC